MKIHDESKAIKCQECGKLFDTTQKHKVGQFTVVIYYPVGSAGD
jgi:hypothetical protein